MKPKKSKQQTKRLQARAATMDQASEFENYGAEPNMKLSHAFMVVLALHVVAVGGLFAFNKAKANHASKIKREEHLAQEVSTPEASEPMANVAQESKSVSTPLKATTSQEISSTKKIPKIYHVVKGDTLAKVASKQKVSLAVLQQANGLKKGDVLHIGQSLKIPGKFVAAVAASAVAQAEPMTTTMPPSSSGGTSQPLVSTNTAAHDTVVPSQESGGKSEVSPVAQGTASTTLAQEGAVPLQHQEVATSASQLASDSLNSQEKATPAPKKVTASDATMTEYTVRKGDTPYKIAKRFHVNYDELMKINNISDARKVQIGQKLIIPVAKKKPSTPKKMTSAAKKKPSITKRKSTRKSTAKHLARR